MLRYFVFLLYAFEYSLACAVQGCAGHGECVDAIFCKCQEGFSGPDCGTRACPGGPSWSGSANATNDIHSVVAECSNMGTCDEVTGLCTCEEGFEGPACERMSCPEGSGVTVGSGREACSGHGRCLTLGIMGSTNDGNALVFTTGAYNRWDADRIMGCACDEGWEGYDCSQRLDCPLGDDPFTLGQINEIQLLDCDCAGASSCASDTFTLRFRGFTTEEIAAVTSAAQLRDALMALRNVDDVAVNIETNGETTICSETGVTTSITFTHNSGTHPSLAPTIVEGSSFETISIASHGSASELDGSIESVTGTRERIPCSGRGTCVNGRCACFDGFGHSDGSLQGTGHDGALGNEGNRGDCGRFLGTTASTAYCPTNIAGAICNGHGTCDQSTGYTCLCDDGYTGRYCAGKECRRGHAWATEPRADLEGFFDGGAHPGGWECSNRGICNRVTGTCACQSMLTGDACERIACPKNSTQSTCSGHGECVDLAMMAALTSSEGVSLGFSYDDWDASMVQGCHCETSHFHGPLLGDVSDWIGYNCGKMSCPTGDDPYTTDQDLEVQSLSCVASSGSFSLTFRGETTDSIAHDATLDFVRSVLEELDTITSVTVTSAGGLATACSAGASVAVEITFLYEFGDLPTLTYDDTLLTGSVAVTESVRGTREELECSNRGRCDRSNGRCVCFSGTCSSDGNGALGQRGDCGFINEKCSYKAFSNGTIRSK